MKNLIFSLILVTTLLIFSGFDKTSEIKDNRDLSYKTVDANNISTVIWNNGSMDRHWSGGYPGFEWPKTSGKFAVYISGLWLSARVNDSVRVSISEYNSEFTPGYFDYTTQTAMGINDPLYRVYKVSPIYPGGNSDFDSWNVWPVNQGAPWVDNNNNGIYEPPADNPLMKGDQNFFCCFTDGYLPSGIISRPAPPLRAEVHLYAWAREFSNCADAINYEWTIINKNRTGWTEMSAALWSDIDIGTSNNDKAGTDSVLNLSFGYNGVSNDPIYGTAPPAIGIVIKEASGHGLNKSDFASFWKCPEFCPLDSLQRFRVLHGLRTNGSRWINPITNTATNFPYSGNAAAQTGWIDSTMGERYIINGSIFGNVLPLDTIEFKTVTFIKKGADNLSSLTELKNCAGSVISVNSLFTQIPSGIELYQNFPNPFNPNTIISYQIPELNSGNSDIMEVTLKVYDILGKEIAVLVNETKSPGDYEAEFTASNLSSGIYFYSLNVNGYVVTKSMVLMK